jgi:hypothetical protein
MWAVQFNNYGGPDVLHVGEVAEPHAGAGQVRVAVRAVLQRTTSRSAPEDSDDRDASAQDHEEARRGPSAEEDRAGHQIWPRAALGDLPGRRVITPSARSRRPP